MGVVCGGVAGGCGLGAPCCLIHHPSHIQCNYESAREDHFLDIPLVIKPFGSSKSYTSVVIPSLTHRTCLH